MQYKEIVLPYFLWIQTSPPQNKAISAYIVNNNCSITRIAGMWR